MPFFSNIGPSEIFIIALVLVLLFGGKTLHKWARELGQAGKEVKQVKKELETGFNDDSPLEEIEETPKKTHHKRKREVE